MTVRGVYCSELESHDVVIEGIDGIDELYECGHIWLMYGFNIRLLPDVTRNPWGINGTPKSS